MCLVHGDIYESEAQVRDGQDYRFMCVSSTYLWQLAIRMDEIVQHLQGNKIRRLSMVPWGKPTLKDRMRNQNPQRISGKNYQRGQRDNWENTVSQGPIGERVLKWEWPTTFRALHWANMPLHSEVREDHADLGKSTFTGTRMMKARLNSADE